MQCTPASHAQGYLAYADTFLPRTEPALLHLLSHDANLDLALPHNRAAKRGPHHRSLLSLPVDSQAVLLLMPG